MQRLYVASSWRNPRQPHVVAQLRDAGHQVYDFRNPHHEGPPTAVKHGFAWSEIDPDWQRWTPEQFRKALGHDLAEAGFAADFEAMRWATAFVLVLPCGRSAHLEAGWAMGLQVPTAVLLDAESEPELMYKLTEPDGEMCATMEEVLYWLAGMPSAQP